MSPVGPPTISETVSSLALGLRPEVLRVRPPVSLPFTATLGQNRGFS